MVRVKRGNVARIRRKSILQLAKGYRGRNSKIFRMANQKVTIALRYAFNGRRERKRLFRKLWIRRISAAAKLNNLYYNKIIQYFKNSNIDLNRKMLSQIAVLDNKSFIQLVSTILY